MNKQTNWQDYEGGREEAEFFYTPATLPSESTLPEDVPVDNIESKSKDFLQALTCAEEITFKKPRDAPRTPWITSELAEKLHIAKNKMAEHNPAGEEEYKRAKSQARKIKRDWVVTNLEQAQ